ncbi:hypothetical protein PC116_g25420 [Phytophthora cactorum]|uniref:Uncharacterized protein n=1 Tax=Phytophthora cactorum TaxID=29920 RepID=A0A8T1JND1_9STRA|nr:hypothetical protein PC111_g21076 [Phytophthora cactorum]KAG2799591.1 hypothetical protein PC112_g20838 [Phytophthora cactorum]KAG2832274.1 hypothetical protein PC113_g20785 [Phytophthora cactorum]KAG2877717.1 hypothetical protein PC114_g23489 [Phytophthora cactorum]KAG2885663.1 hypothetical protein PC115_g20936 [Phytophthora cactorum]
MVVKAVLADEVAAFSFCKQIESFGKDQDRWDRQVKQWYCRGGWFSDSFAEIKIQVEELKVDDQPKLVHAKVAQGNEILVEMNDSLGVGFVKEMYQDFHAQLKETFPQCDFSDLKIGWETATNTLQTRECVTSIEIDYTPFAFSNRGSRTSEMSTKL